MQRIVIIYSAMVCTVCFHLLMLLIVFCRFKIISDFFYRKCLNIVKRSNGGRISYKSYPFGQSNYMYILTGYTPN